MGSIRSSGVDAGLLFPARYPERTSKVCRLTLEDINKRQLGFQSQQIGLAGDRLAMQVARRAVPEEKRDLHRPRSKSSGI